MSKIVIKRKNASKGVYKKNRPASSQKVEAQVNKAVGEPSRVPEFQSRRQR